jgi:uncharacterized Tic20 family protein
MSVESSNPILVAPLQSPTMSQAEERNWSVVAHLTILLNLVTGFAGSLVALVIYLVFKDRSRKVAYHALQSMIFQLIWWYGGGLLIGGMWLVVGVLSALLIGIILIPVALILTLLLLLLPIAAIVYGVVAAVQLSQDVDFKYWLVGDWVRSTLTGA